MRTRDFIAVAAVMGIIAFLFIGFMSNTLCGAIMAAAL